MRALATAQVNQRDQVAGCLGLSAWARRALWIRSGLLGGLVAACLTACAKPVDQVECDQLLTHYVDLLVRNEQPDVHFEEVRKKQSQALTKAQTDPQFAQCTEQVSRRQFDCAMAATNPDVMEQCLVF